LLIEIPNKDIIEIGNDYYKLKELTAEIYYFEYNNRLYSIEELNEDVFNYFTGSIKANQTLIERVTENLYQNKIVDVADMRKNMIDSEWADDDAKWKKGKTKIRDVFFGILTTHIDNIINLGDNLNEDKDDKQNRIDYVKKSFDIVERIINISVFCFLAQMIENKEKNIIETLLLLDDSKDDKIGLLSQLLDNYSSRKNDENEILSHLLQKRDTTDKETILFGLAKELFDLNGGRKKKKVDLNQFDCYRAEIILSEFLIHFSFLANYNLISIGGIEYHNMLGNQKPPYIQRLLSGKRGCDYKETSFSLSHAVILTDATGKHCANLFPFLIDNSSLKPNATISDFLFFCSCDRNENARFKDLNYRKEDGEPIIFSYEESIKTYQDTQIIDSSKGETVEEKVIQYNINRLMDSLREEDLQTT
ncbi:MAG: hypothetical protein LBT04_05240, partial [Prevotellaceae bacterium]|nr:hypothetical protein [Prevotellaceae bacterium]